VVINEITSNCHQLKDLYFKTARVVLLFQDNMSLGFRQKKV